MAEEPQEVFAYADPVTQSGVTVERRDGSLRVTTPPEKFTKIHRGYYLGLAFSLHMLISGIVETIVMGPTMLFPCVEGLGFTLLMAGLIYLRVRSTNVFAIENGILSVTRLCWPLAPRVRSWHLSEISEVKFNVHNGKLLVRVVGKGFVEFYISRQKELTKYVVQVLSEGVQRLPQQAVEGVARAVPAVNAPPKSIVGWIITLAVIPVLLIVIFPQLAVIWIWLLFLPVAVVGITFGTQKKDFWF